MGAKDTYGPSLGEAGAVGGVSAMGRRNPSDLATPVRDKMARTAWAWPDEVGRGSFEEVEVPFARGDLGGVWVSPELISFGGSWRRSSAIEGQSLRNSLKEWGAGPSFF